MTTLIKIPFAQSGDKTIPPDTSTDGTVNWTTGYGSDYSKDPATDASAKRIERELMNGIFNALSTALNEIQVNGVAPFITATDNGGTAFAYGLGAVVSYNNKIWLSLVTANTVTPTEGTSWSELLVSSKVGTASARNVGNGSNQIPDMNNFTTGSSANGWWKKNPNGIIEQYGLISNMSSTGITPSFPIAFPSEMRSFTVGVTGNSGANNYPIITVALNPSVGTRLTHFTATGYNTSVSGATSLANVIFYYYAVGI